MNDCLRKRMARRRFIEKAAQLSFQLGLISVVPGCPGPRPAGRPTTAAVRPPTPTPTPAATATPEKGDAPFEPAYLKLHRTGELRKRADELWAVLEQCRLCPRQCGANRLGGASGFCRAPGASLVISAYHAHFGEERPLVGWGGSGTIFLTHCNLRCVFCQNWQISHLGRGDKESIDSFAAMMLELQGDGCHNINIVTPTHYSPHILKAVDVAAAKGLRVPIVYNTSGWERREILAFLDGVVDIYLPDFKYWDSEMAAKYSAGAANYPEVTKEAILEMNRQVGVARPGPKGIMQRGVMIRHLVMPSDIGGSERVMEWIAANLPKDTYVNIMVQYTPAHKAYDYPELSRRITEQEYKTVVQRALALGLTNLDIQGYRWLF